jgi:hypothetical protein
MARVGQYQRNTLYVQAPRLNFAAERASRSKRLRLVAIGWPHANRDLFAQALQRFAVILDHATSLVHGCFFRRPTRKIMIPLQVWHPKEQAAWVNLIATRCKPVSRILGHAKPDEPDVQRDAGQRSPQSGAPA